MGLTNRENVNVGFTLWPSGGHLCGHPLQTLLVGQKSGDLWAKQKCLHQEVWLLSKLVMWGRKWWQCVGCHEARRQHACVSVLSHNAGQASLGPMATTHTTAGLLKLFIAVLSNHAFWLPICIEHHSYIPQFVLRACIKGSFITVSKVSL